MTLRINGASREVGPLRTIADLVHELQLVAGTVLIEHNGTALRRDEWPARALQENDSIEVLQIVAGG